MNTQEATMREAITVHVHMNKRHWDALREAGHADILEDTPENRVIVVHWTYDGDSPHSRGDTDMTEAGKEGVLIDTKDAIERVLDIGTQHGWENVVVNVYFTGAASHAGLYGVAFGMGLMARMDFRVLHEINFKQWDRDRRVFWTIADLWEVLQ